MPENDPAAPAEAPAPELLPAAPADPIGWGASTLPNAGDDTQRVTPSDALPGTPEDARLDPAPDTPSSGPVDAPARGPELSTAECAQRLADLFPALFGPAQAPAPIKLRIQVDIQARAPGVFTRRVLSAFLSRHTTTTAYLKALVHAPHRVDLDGQPAGELSDVHRQAATEELARRRALQEARREGYRLAHREAQRQANRPTQQPVGVDSNAGGGDVLPPAAASDAGAPGGVRPDGRAARRPPGPRPPRSEPRRAGPRATEAGTFSAPGAAGDMRPWRGDPNAGHPRHPSHPDRAGRPGRPNRPDPAGPRVRPQGPPVPVASPGGLAGDQPSPYTRPQDPAEVAGQRERAALLRAFESSTLSKSNFCVLKRLSEAELDAQLAQARQERGPAPGRPVR